MGSRHLHNGSGLLPTHASVAAGGDARCVRRHTTISSHRRLGLVGGEQRVACRPIRTEPVSPALCVPRASRGVLSTKAATSNLAGSGGAAAAARERPFLMHVIKWTDTRKQRRSSGAGAGNERRVPVKRRPLARLHCSVNINQFIVVSV